MKAIINKASNENKPLEDVLAEGRTAEELVSEVRKDFEQRRERRRRFELQWRLNMSYVAGKQFTYISPNGEIAEAEKNYYWSERQVYNHLAPILETRLAKLGRVRPKMSVTPTSADENDIYAAKMSAAILNSAYQKLELDRLIGEATMWSETCGTAFYKIVWDSEKGKILGIDEKTNRNLCEGEVSISVIPPFEIFPDTVEAGDIEYCSSIIHARAVSVDEVKDIWGVDVTPEEITVMDIGLQDNGLFEPKPYADRRCMVIERYERPTKHRPNGRLIIVAGDKLLHLGELPSKIGEDDCVGYPFVMQRAVTVAGCFWGVSIIERTIPVQQAYNAVKNRKHEFLNRIAMGVLAVEDGAVDIESIAEEGLPPGKVVVYRQGANPPIFMDSGRLPSEFNYEEDRLMSEFISISGVSEIMRNSQVPSSVSSGVGLQLLIEQDDTRLSLSAELIREAVKKTAKIILRLYKQYAANERISRIAGEDGNIELLHWKASNITSDEVVFVTENELNETPANKRNFIFDLLKVGLLSDENGKLSNHMRHKLLDMLGLGVWENARDIESLQIKKALMENKDLISKEIDVDEIDDHELHIQEHTKFMLSSDFARLEKAQKENFYNHLRHHKNAISLSNEHQLKSITEASDDQ